MKFKFYKEPTILIGVLLISFVAIIYILATPPSTDATVDNVVPLPLQLNSKQSSEQTEHTEPSLPTNDISPSQSTSIESSNPLGGLNLGGNN